MKKIFTLIVLVCALSISAESTNLLDDNAFSFETDSSFWTSAKTFYTLDSDFSASNGNTSLKIYKDDATIGTKWQCLISSKSDDSSRTTLASGINYTYTMDVYIKSGSVVPTKILTSFSSSVLNPDNSNKPYYMALNVDIPSDIATDSWVTLTQEFTTTEENQITDSKYTIKLTNALFTETGTTEMYIDNIKIVASTATGINDTDKDSDVSVVTDYNSGIINIISANSDSNVAIYNLCGQEVARETLSTSNATVDFSNENAGMYIVKIDSGNKSYSKKILWK